MGARSRNICRSRRFVKLQSCSCPVDKRLFKIAQPKGRVDCVHPSNPEHDKEDSLSQSRRAFLMLTATSLAAMRAGYTFGAVENPKGEIAVRLTAGSTARFASQPGLKWQPVGKTSGPAILLDPSKTYQEVLGVGAALTEAACYMFNQLTADVREQIFRELYHPSEMVMACVGRASVRATTPQSPIATMMATRTPNCSASRSTTIGPTFCRCYGSRAK